MKKLNIILIICLCLLCTGCTNSSKKISKFQEELESYKDSNIEIDTNNIDVVKYSNVTKINKIIKNGTEVIFIGKMNNDLNRRAISVLLEAADNTDLETIYYINSLNDIEGLDSIENINTPLVLFILDGNIQTYHIGTIENKEELSEDETIELYNIYSEGIHKVLQDACDDSC